MKKFVKVLATSAMALSFAAVSAMAGNDMPSGAHFQFNLIGHPGNDTDVLKQNADNSNGRAIMVPLSNTKSAGSIDCTVNGVYQDFQLDDDTEATWSQDVPKGAKISFVGGDHYEIIDRDATDQEGAEVMLKVTTETDAEGNEYTTRAFDVYVRVLGKKSQCMTIGGYAEDVDATLDDKTVGGWFWSGTVTLGRKAGKPVTSSLNELFEVHYCQDLVTVNEGQPNEKVECASKSDEVEISVFDDVFEDYVWNIVNEGTRNVQVRFYPKGAPVK